MIFHPCQGLILRLLALATSLGLGLSGPASDPASDPGLVPDPPTAGGSAPAPKISASSDFRCDLPPILDPSSVDRLPSADQLFSSHAALMLQVKRHQALVRIPSITYDDMGPPDQDPRWRPFRELHRVLQLTYPAVHGRSTLETINSLALLYTIKGSNPNLKPILLAAHQDVVPVADEKAWKYPPFEAHFDGQRLWGRGAMDDKCSLTAIMSALEALLACPSWKPSRTILLAFGFDEETGGERGAAEIAARLDSRYRKEDGSDSLALVVDEGGLGLETVEDVVYALPSVYEKGYVDIWLELQTVGGHSSMPPPHTAIGIMAHLVVALEAHPYEPMMLADGPIHRQLICQTRYSPNANPELSQAVERGDLGAIAQAWIRARPEFRYLIQTSQAIDVISGGLKINALPEVVSVGVNYRVAPQDSVELVQHRLIETLADVASRFNLTVRTLEGKDSSEAPERLLRKQHQSPVQSWLPTPGRDLVVGPHQEAESAEAGLEANFGPDSATLWVRGREQLKKSPMAPTDGPIWDTLAGSIRYTFSSGNLTVVPAGQGMAQNTDTRHYQNLTRHIYRWMPTRPGDYDGVHTVDENILMEGHINFVKFYYDLVRNFDAQPV